MDALDEHDLESGISVKLTGLGLALYEDLCHRNLEEIIAYAGERELSEQQGRESLPRNLPPLATRIRFHLARAAAGSPTPLSSVLGTPEQPIQHPRKR